jgi:glycosyltransferase involved in cell wall biosynthesis
MTPTALFTIIIPVHNGSSTLPLTFASLEKQKDKKLIHKIIIIDDGSTDNSLNLIKQYATKSSYQIKIVHHPQSQGLATSYNQGLKIARTPYFTIMHQDIVIVPNNSFSLILSSFKKAQNIISVYPRHCLPEYIFKQYNFWQKVLFSRLRGKKVPGGSGKFDTFNRQIFLNVIGHWDQNTYRTAGEDGDISHKIKLSPYQTVVTKKLEIDHVHSIDKNFGPQDYLKKEMQLNEAYGVQIRRGNFTWNLNLLFTCFRQILCFSLLVPYLNLLSLTFIIIYAFLYSQEAIKERGRGEEWQAYFLLPLINIFLIFATTFSFCKGFILKKQQI